MPLRHLLYRCPACGHDPAHGEGDRARCDACGAAYERARGGGIAEERPGEGRRVRPVPELVDAVARRGGPVPAATGADGRLRWEARALVREAVAEEPVRYRGALLGFSERFGPARSGRLILTDDALAYRPEGRGGEGTGEGRSVVEEVRRWPLAGLRALQTSSKALQVTSPSGSVVAFRFPGDSPRRWEELLEHALRETYRREGRGEIVEFQPRIVTRREGGALRGGGEGGERRRRLPAPGPGEARGTTAWYRVGKRIARALIPLLGGADVEGRRHVPARGPFVLVANHVSYLDPILIQAVCPRTVHSMTKSTQYASGLFRWLLPRIHTFPVRRFRVDAQTVRVLLRKVEAGRGVGIYPEGERSWDGRLQPFRRGSVRVLLKAGVPVVPCGISGTYALWPRWSSRIRRSRIRIRFGEALDLGGPLHDRRAREAALPEATGRLRGAVEALLE